MDELDAAKSAFYTPSKGEKASGQVRPVVVLRHVSPQRRIKVLSKEISFVSTPVDQLTRSAFELAAPKSWILPSHSQSNVKLLQCVRPENCGYTEQIADPLQNSQQCTTFKHSGVNRRIPVSVESLSSHIKMPTEVRSGTEQEKVICANPKRLVRDTPSTMGMSNQDILTQSCKVTRTLQKHEANAEAPKNDACVSYFTKNFLSTIEDKLETHSTSAGTSPFSTPTRGSPFSTPPRGGSARYLHVLSPSTVSPRPPTPALSSCCETLTPIPVGSSTVKQEQFMTHYSAGCEGLSPKDTLHVTKPLWPTFGRTQSESHVLCAVGGSPLDNQISDDGCQVEQESASASRAPPDSHRASPVRAARGGILINGKLLSSFAQDSHARSPPRKGQKAASFPEKTLSYTPVPSENKSSTQAAMNMTRAQCYSRGESPKRRSSPIDPRRALPHHLLSGDDSQFQQLIEELLFESLPRENVCNLTIKRLQNPSAKQRFRQTVWEDGNKWSRVQATWHLAGNQEAAEAIATEGIRCDEANCACGRYGLGGYVALTAAKANAYADVQHDVRHLFCVLALPDQHLEQGRRGVRPACTAADLPGHPTELCFVDESRLYCPALVTYQWASTGRRSPQAPRVRHVVPRRVGLRRSRSVD